MRQRIVVTLAIALTACSSSEPVLEAPPMPDWLAAYARDRIRAVAERDGFTFFDNDVARRRDGCGGWTAAFTKRVEWGTSVREAAIYAEVAYCRTEQQLRQRLGLVGPMQPPRTSLLAGAAGVMLRVQDVGDPAIEERYWKQWTSAEAIAPITDVEKLERLAAKICESYKVSARLKDETGSIVFTRDLQNRSRERAFSESWNEPRKVGDAIIAEYRKCMVELVDAARPIELEPILVRVYLGADQILEMRHGTRRTEPEVVFDHFDEVRLEKP